jgi:predicted porin
MQKKIIALAVAGLVSGAAFAQTNVTVYGRASAGCVYSKSDFKKFSGIDAGKGIGGTGLDGGNRLGFRGEEVLGNGLKGIFKFEWGVNTDEGGGPTGARYTYVGLAGNFGQVTLGRNGTPSDFYAGATDPHGVSGYEPVVMLRDNFGNGELLTGARWNNSIEYVSPNLSGFEFTGIYSFGEKTNTSKSDKGYNGAVVTTPGTSSSATPTYAYKYYEGAETTDAGKLGLGVKYANGPLYLAAVYEAQADDDGQQVVGTPSNKGYGAKGWFLGGSYDFKVVKLYANYYRQKANHSGKAYNSALGGSDKQSVWSIGAGIPVSSAGTVTLQYAQYKDYLDNRESSVANPGHKAKGYGIGYNHNLSKRTSLYANVTRIDNDRGIDAGLAKTGVAGKDQTTFITGIAHNF